MKVIKSKKIRSLLRFLIPFVILPLCAFLCAAVIDPDWHLAISVLTALFSVLLFISGYEKEKVGARRAVVLSVMTALSVVGRFIPLFKPVSAICTFSGMYLGGEAGFLVGALSALLSNFYFGQGPWTPFQMLAWGLIGLFAGVFSKALIKSRPLLLTYATLSGIFFSLIMDVYSALWFSGELTAEHVLAAVVTALPHTVIYIISNCFFTLLLSGPFGRKLVRVKKKYGI